MQTSFLPLLTLTFIILKLCNVIAWSWWLVALPSLIGLVIGLIALVFLIITILKA